MKVLVVGLGPIGQAVYRELLRRGWPVCGAVDLDPALVGKPAGAPLGEEAGPVVTDDLAWVLSERPDVAILTTLSSVARIEPDLRRLLGAGVSVVTSSEEMLFPSLRYPEIATQLDALARERGARVLGTGVNPGLVMDTLAVVATAPCLEVNRIRVERVVDAATRRAPLVRKVGAGLAPAVFRQRAAAGELGHRGLAESAALVGDALGWGTGEIEERVEPVLLEKETQVAGETLPAGSVAGIHHTARLVAGGELRVELDLRMYVGAPDPHDRTVVEGSPRIELRAERGVPGDEATVAMLVNAVPALLRAPPGLHTVATLPIPRWSAASSR